MDIKGDLKLKRTGLAERRFDQGLITLPVLAAAYNVLRHSHAWLEVATDGNGAQDVILPDASTLPLGYKIVVHNVGSVDNISVKDNGGGLLKLLIPAGVDNYAYEFVLYNNGSPAGGWYVWALDDFDTQVASRYVHPFNATSDWGAAALGYYSHALLESVHTRGPNPIFQIFETVGSDFVSVALDQAKMNASGDVTLRVTAGDAEDAADIDARFAGKMILI